MSFRIPPVAILLSLAVGLASADIGLVADIDGDYTNGPDTLLMDPGDTVQVNIWITGTDSLVGFGITLGDTSGALAWIEEADSLVYRTPSGWTDISIQMDSLGWILLQSSDFAFSTPLVLPSKVAEMDFVVAPGESCGVIAFDPEMSGWQNSLFTEGAYSEPAMGTSCGGNLLDGGGLPLPDDSSDAGGDLSEPSLPIDSETGRSLVAPEEWSSFPILRTEQSKGMKGTSVGHGAYMVYFRDKPTVAVTVALESEDGQVLAESPPSIHRGLTYEAESTSRSPSPHFPIRFVEEVYDEVRDTVFQADLPDTAYFARFIFDADFTAGNFLVVLFNAEAIFRERISSRLAPGSAITPELRTLTPDERYSRYIEKRVTGRRRMGDTEAEIQQLRDDLEQRRAEYIRRSK